MKGKTVTIDGIEYELVPKKTDVDMYSRQRGAKPKLIGYLLKPIEPIQPEEKRWEVKLLPPMHRDFTQNIHVNLNCPEDTAEKIRNFIQAGMEYLYADGTVTGEHTSQASAKFAKLQQVAHATRSDVQASLEGDNT